MLLRIKYIVILSICSAFQGVASQREITLYPNDDLKIYESKEVEPKKIRVGLTESFFNFEYLPCHVYLNQIPLIYSVLQAGPSCAWKSSTNNAFGVMLIPEAEISNYKFKNPALNLGLKNAFTLISLESEWLFISKIFYKFFDSQLLHSANTLDTRQLLQLWGNSLDSNITLGFLYNDNVKNRIESSPFSLFIYYKQSLPLAWRQIGGARKTASLEYTSLGCSLRKEFADFFVLGAGLAYWSLTFDGIRVSGPLPEFYFALDF